MIRWLSATFARSWLAFWSVYIIAGGALALATGDARWLRPAGFGLFVGVGGWLWFR